MFRMSLLAAVFSIVLVPVLTTAEEPKNEDLDPNGKPAKYKVGSGKYAIWYDKDGWHLRATSNKDGQAFTGRIDAVGGGFVGMRLVSFTAKDPKAAPGKMLDIKSKGFDVKFTLVKGSESGFDLKVDEKATMLKFSLKVDDAESPELIMSVRKARARKASSSPCQRFHPRRSDADATVLAIPSAASTGRRFRPGRKLSLVASQCHGRFQIA